MRGARVVLLAVLALAGCRADAADVAGGGGGEGAPVAAGVDALAFFSGAASDNTKPGSTDPYSDACPWPHPCALATNVTGCTACNMSDPTRPNKTELVVCSGCSDIGYVFNSATGLCDCKMGWGSFKAPGLKRPKPTSRPDLPTEPPTCTVSDLYLSWTKKCCCRSCDFEGGDTPWQAPIEEAQCVGVDFAQYQRDKPTPFRPAPTDLLGAT